MRIIFFALFALLLCFGCGKINSKFNLDNNNLIEEAVEAVIEGKLGLPAGSIDLTPDSPEN